MDVSMIVPQHGKRFEGLQMISRFLEWVSSVDCGIDLMGQENYRPPKEFV